MPLSHPLPSDPRRASDIVVKLKGDVASLAKSARALAFAPHGKGAAAAGEGAGKEEEEADDGDEEEDAMGAGQGGALPRPDAPPRLVFADDTSPRALLTALPAFERDVAALDTALNAAATRLENGVAAARKQLAEEAAAAEELIKTCVAVAQQRRAALPVARTRALPVPSPPPSSHPSPLTPHSPCSPCFLHPSPRRCRTEVQRADVAARAKEKQDARDKAHEA